MSAALAIQPLASPPDATVTVPGSKSLTNRALVCAALAQGRSELHGVLLADDTEAMFGCLAALGVGVEIVPDGPGAPDAPDGPAAIVVGTGGSLPAGPVDLDARLSGTTAGFVLPMLALGEGPYRLDGAEPLRARPMGDLVAVLRALGLTVDHEPLPGHLPVEVRRAAPLATATVVPGDVSSQFLSGLLLSAPCLPGGLTVEVIGDLVSRPYVDLTLAMMRAFGAEVHETEPRRFRVAPAGYRAARVDIEPDASAASYFFAAAAITGGRVRIAGLSQASLQGDLHFVDVLAQMGAEVTWEDTGVTVQGTGSLHGVDVDLRDCSDTAQTLAAVAVFVDSPTEVRGIGFIRRKETDRIAAVVRELQRLGVEAHETADGFVVQPGVPHPGRVETYDDHRMAMSFALLGLRSPGIEIADPDCVDKTFPAFFEVLDGLRRPVRPAG